MDIFLDIGFFLLGIGVTLVILWFQERSPIVYVQCNIVDGDPSLIKCEIKNIGRGEANDVYVGFNHLLPFNTQIIAKPELGAEIVESNNPPDPYIFPIASEYTRAFAVKVPRVAAKSSAEFMIQTSDRDNQKAAKQISRLYSEMIRVLEKFGEKLLEDHPTLKDDWDIQIIAQAWAKKSNIFQPGTFSYEVSNLPVQFFSETEQRALAVLDDVIKRYKAKYVEVFQTGKRFRAPVIRIKTSNGDRTFGILPPYIDSFVEGQIAVKDIKAGQPQLIQPVIPESYD